MFVWCSNVVNCFDIRSIKIVLMLKIKVMFIYEFIFRNRFNKRLEVCRIETSKNRKEFVIEQFKEATHCSNFISMTKINS